MAVSTVPESPAGLRESKKERTRAALTAAAMRLVAERGYEATTVEAIAGAADVSVRTFHNYFTSKAQLFASKAAELVDDLGARFAAQEPGISAAEAMRRTWHEMVDAEVVDHPLAVLEAAESNVEVRDALERTAATATSDLRRRVAERIGSDDPDSLTTWFAMKLLVSGGALALRRGSVACGPVSGFAEAVDAMSDALVALTRVPSPD